MTKIKRKTTLTAILALLLLFFVALVILLRTQNAGTTRPVQEAIQAQSDLSSYAISIEEKSCLDPLIEKAGHAKAVLLGESSHGTAEYYLWRKKISQRLIQEKDFNFIVVEGDWPTIYMANRYVKDLHPTAVDGRTILSQYDRWPTWMWSNEEFLTMIEWLRDYNMQLPPEDRIGIYGKDIYGVVAAMDKTVRYLEQVDPDFAREAKSYYDCLARYDEDYGRYIGDVMQRRVSCHEGIEKVVEYLKTHADQFRPLDENAYFAAKLSAMSIAYADLHFRSSAHPGAASWNDRVRFMRKALDRLRTFYGRDSKYIVWAHNTHVGDARATTMQRDGRVNIGQLLREDYGQDKVYIVGFGTYTGQVIAGRAWGKQREIMEIPPAIDSSYEARLNRVGLPSFMLFMDEAEVRETLKEVRGHRAKGVVYNPENELGNYVPTSLSQRYDAFIFFETTRPLTPIR